MEVLSLNLIPTGTTPVVHVKQYDVGRTWRFELKEGPLVYTLDGSETIECNIKKKDGNVVTVAVTNTSASYIDIETTLQMTACSGDNLGAIQIMKGSDDIGTLNFILACERSPLENGIESESSIHDLQTQIAEAVAEEVAEQYDSANVIFDNAPTSGHGVGYTVTSEGVKTEVDNLNTALAGKVDTTDFDATNLPIESGSATNTKDYIDNKVTSLTTKKDIKSLVTFSENISGTNTKFFVLANVLYIFYQGENKSHVNDDALFTLPSQYRPSGNYYFPAMVNQNTFGIVELANGVCKLWTLNQSATGRVYFTTAIPLT